MGNPGQPLLDLLRDWNLEEGDHQIGAWPIKQTRQLAVAYGEATAASHAMSLELALSRADALLFAPESVYTRSRRLVERSLFYADLVLARVPQLSSHPELSDAGLQNDVQSGIDHLIHMRQFLKTGVVLPVIDPYVFENEKTNELVSQISKSTQVVNSLTKQALVGSKTELLSAKGREGEEIHAEVTHRVGKLDGLTVGSVTIPCDMAVPIFRDDIVAASEVEICERPELAALRDELVRKRIAHTIGDLQWARQFGNATLVASSSVSWDVLKSIDERVSMASGYPPERIIVDMDLPFLDTFDIDVIVEIRERSSNALLRFRQCLQDIADEVAALEEPNRQAGLNKILQRRVLEPIRDLEEASQSALRRLVAKGLAEIAVVASTTTLAYAAGVTAASAGLPANATAVGAAGAMAALATTVKTSGTRIIDLIDAFATEAKNRRRSPVHMLWKATK